MGYDTDEYFKLLAGDKSAEALRYRTENIPRKLYKFISLNDIPKCKEKCEIENLNDIKIKSLMNNELWLSTYTSFNDPFELKTMYVSSEEVKKYGLDMNLIDYARRIFYDLYLIGCFTTNLEASMPMWAHYGNNHRGCCVEYKIRKPEFFFKVSYEPQRAPATVFFQRFFYFWQKMKEGIITEQEQRELDSYILFFQHNLTIKHNSWMYENEYRLLFPQSKVKNKINGGATISNNDLGIEITAIYLGISCEGIYRNKLKDIGNARGINVYQMYFDDGADKYELSYKIVK